MNRFQHSVRPPDRGAVLVTGGSSGIGQACARRLDAAGYSVYAGVRRHQDGNQLRRNVSEDIRPIMLDVTSEQQISAALGVIEHSLPQQGLVGLVNNAGIMVSGPLEHTPPAALRKQLEVNLVGQVSITQVFLPLLRASRGRIVNIGSTSGRIAGAFLGPYCASKFALEAVTIALREELLASQVSVHMVEPGVVSTPLWDKVIAAEKALGTSLSTEARKHYGKELAHRQDRLQRLKVHARSADGVCEAVLHALGSEKPKPRYVVGWDARLKTTVASLIPQRLWFWLKNR